VLIGVTFGQMLISPDWPYQVSPLWPAFLCQLIDLSNVSVDSEIFYPPISFIMAIKLQDNWGWVIWVGWNRRGLSAHLQLNHYKGSGGNKKTPSHTFQVGTYRSTQHKLPHHHGRLLPPPAA
jgi:hypothetical protein